MRRQLRATALAVSLCLVAVGCSDSDPAPTAEDAGPLSSVAASEPEATSTPEPIAENAIVVGVILDEQQMMSSLDRQPGVGFVGAIEAIGEADGVLERPVHVLRTNSESRLSVVDQAARRMIEAGAQLLVVTCELDFARPAIDRANEADVIVISPCAGESEWGDGRAGELAFSMVTQPSVYGAEMAGWLWSEGERSATVVWDATAPESRAECAGFITEWEGLGGVVHARSPVNLFNSANVLVAPDVEPGFRSADVVVLCGGARIGGRMLEGLRAAGIVTPIVAGPTMDNAVFHPGDVEGLGDFKMFTFASARGDDPAPAVEVMIDQYRSVDGIDPSGGRFILGADLALVWVQAVEAAGSLSGRDVAAEILATESFDGASGPLSFDGGQSASGRRLRVMRHQDGEMVFDRLWP